MSETQRIEWCETCGMDCEYDEAGNCIICGSRLKDD